MSVSINNLLSKGILVKQMLTSKFNNRVYLYEYDKHLFVLREIGEQYNIDSKGIGKLFTDIKTYYELLKCVHGVIIPSIFTIKNEYKLSKVRLLTEYFEKDINSFTKNQSRPLWLKGILNALFALINYQREYYKKHGSLYLSLDPNPNNFMSHNYRTPIYNDFTPPLFIKNGYWNEYRRIDEKGAIKKEKIKRYFNKSNLLLNFINKSRIYLQAHEFDNFLKYVIKKTAGSIVVDNEIKNLLELFQTRDPTVYIKTNRVLSEYCTERDLLRYIIVSRSTLNNDEIKSLFKISKKTDGINLLRRYVKK